MISTTVISALPIAALMVVAVWLMGVGTLKDLSLVQLIGVIEGTFSSVFLATPIVVSLKNRQQKYRAHNKAVARVRARQEAEGDVDAQDVDDDVDAAASSAHATETVAAPRQNTSFGASWRPDRDR